MRRFRKGARAVGTVAVGDQEGGLRVDAALNLLSPQDPDGAAVGGAAPPAAQAAGAAQTVPRSPRRKTPAGEYHQPDSTGIEGRAAARPRSTTATQFVTDDDYEDEGAGTGDDGGWQVPDSRHPPVELEQSEDPPPSSPRSPRFLEEYHKTAVEHGVNGDLAQRVKTTQGVDAGAPLVAVARSHQRGRAGDNARTCFAQILRSGKGWPSHQWRMSRRRIGRSLKKTGRLGCYIRW